MRTCLYLAGALLMTTAPAHAQLVGGLGGSLGGSLGGTLNGAGSIGSIGSTIDSVRSSTSGTLDGAASSSGGQSVDRKSGKVHADRNASASGSGGMGELISSPSGFLGGSASGNGSASGSGNADAQLLGTDAARSAASGARGQASGAASGAANTLGALTSGAGSASGNLAGSGAGNAAGSSGPLAFAGDGAGSGGFTITKGAPVFAPDGDKIGKVREIFTNGRGQIQQLLVNVDGSKVLLPASNFSANGSGVVSAMTEGEIKKTGEQQTGTKGTAPAEGKTTNAAPAGPAQP